MATHTNTIGARSIAHCLQPFRASRDDLSNFPGWNKAPGFLTRFVEATGARRVADIGGGANPMLAPEVVARHLDDYALIDISRRELDKAPGFYSSKIEMDLGAPNEAVDRALHGRRYDLVFSHMFMEHIADPLRAHANIWRMLRRGGHAIHMMPSRYNLPLLLNSLLPESVTRSMVRIAQPERDLEGSTGKFPAYYRMCGLPSRQSTDALGAIGFEVLTYTSFVGHDYYRRFPLLSRLERALRKPLISLNAPFSGALLLVLRKR